MRNGSETLLLNMMSLSTTDPTPTPISSLENPNRLQPHSSNRNYFLNITTTTQRYMKCLQSNPLHRIQIQTSTSLTTSSRSAKQSTINTSLSAHQTRSCTFEKL
ncbi:hypothetical protein KC19_VG092900 [Ceratodon purpureus]|uniref:Uncharacterized protein n=1 Tax=Ceratodon purpureus TaxID=3225 RepID=A0A8T0HNI5_CERPU|nr:hypothetical protein KC19_VG092900 [Ceratodon purpureus]